MTTAATIVTGFAVLNFMFLLQVIGLGALVVVLALWRSRVGGDGHCYIIGNYITTEIVWHHLRCYTGRGC